MRRVRRMIGVGLLSGVLLGALAGYAQPAAADVEIYFGPVPPPVYYVPPAPPPVYLAPPPAPWGWHRGWEPGYRYYDRGYYSPGWRHDGRGWRYEQGYYGR